MALPQTPLWHRSRREAPRQQANRICTVFPSGSLEDERFAFLDATQDEKVEQTQLDALTPAVSKALGLPYRMQLIPYARSLEDQVDLISLLSGIADPGEAVTLDLAHGLRYLPMLGLLSALYLDATGGAKVQDIFYGALPASGIIAAEHVNIR